jgi:hypothetical protein
MISRRLLVAAAACAPLGAALAADAPVVEVWKTPTCGCCKVWVRHLEDAGFRVQVAELADLAPIKARFRVPPELSSCHTALVSGYVVEGHVPADDVIRLLRERPKIRGIFTPGMPVGSPGMEGPNPEPYDVLALDDAGKVSVFATHRP